MVLHFVKVIVFSVWLPVLDLDSYYPTVETFKMMVSDANSLLLSCYDSLSDPPTIRHISPDVSASVGDIITLVCRASGKPPPKITWKKLSPYGEAKSK